jgi:hypothetical protein
MKALKPLVWFMSALFVTFFVTSGATAMAPPNGFREIRSTSNSVTVEVGERVRVSAIVLTYGKRYRERVGDPLTWRRIYNTNQDRVLALCESRGYRGQRVGDTAPWKDCPEAQRTIMLRQGLAGAITIVFESTSDELPEIKGALPTPPAAASASSVAPKPSSVASAAPAASSLVAVPSGTPSATAPVVATKTPPGAASAERTGTGSLEPPRASAPGVPSNASQLRMIWNGVRTWFLRVLPLRVWQACVIGLVIAALIVVSMRWLFRNRRLSRGVTEMRAFITARDQTIATGLANLGAAQQELQSAQVSCRTAEAAVIRLEHVISEGMDVVCAVLGFPRGEATSLLDLLQTLADHLRSITERHAVAEQQHAERIAALEGEVSRARQEASLKASADWQRIAALEDEVKTLRASAASSAKERGERDEKVARLEREKAELLQQIASAVQDRAAAVQQWNLVQRREQEAVARAEQILETYGDKLRLVMQALRPIAQSLNIHVQEGEGTPLVATATLLADRIALEWKQRVSRHPDFLETPRPTAEERHETPAVNTLPGVAGPAPGTIRPPAGHSDPSRLPPPPRRPAGIRGTYSSVASAPFVDGEENVHRRITPVSGVPVVSGMVRHDDGEKPPTTRRP